MPTLSRRDREPVDAIYLDYATGALSEPARLLVDTHLALRPERRMEAALWEVAGAAMFEHEVEAVDQDALNAVLRRLDLDSEPEPQPRAADLPGPLGDVIGRPVDALEWRPAASGALEFVMPRWPQARLIRMTGPQESRWSLGEELSLVLDGRLEVDGASYARGDLLLVDRDQAAPAGDCLYFSVQDSGYSARDVREVVSRPGGTRKWAWRRS